MKLPARDLDEAAARVMRNGGEALRGRSILLTGGTGFIGRWIIESFCRLNAAHDLRARMAILTRDSERFQASAPHLAADPALMVVNGDLRALALGQSSPAPQQCDAVVHGATESSETLARDPRAFLATIEATRDALDFAVRTRARRFLYLSSGLVYGRQPRDLSHIPEDYAGAPDPLDTDSAYGETKRDGELLCASYAKQFGLEVVIARGFAFIGPHLPLDRNFAAGNFLRDALNGAPIQIRGDGTPLRSYLYAADLAWWLWVLLLKGASGRAYNVGSENALSIAELAREAAGLVHPPLTVTIAGVPAPGKAPLRYVPSTARARSELGLEETVDWRTAFGKTYEWHRESRMAEAPARSA
jgi:dTDP-glucose 4,6-dehydratase